MSEEEAVQSAPTPARSTNRQPRDNGKPARNQSATHKAPAFVKNTWRKSTTKLSLKEWAREQSKTQSSLGQRALGWLNNK